MSQGLASIDVSNFYFGRYPQGPNAEPRCGHRASSTATAGAFTEDPDAEHADNDPNNYDVKEKVAAFYAKNTNRFGRLRLEEGVRVEHTSGTYDGFAIQLDDDGNWLSTSPSNQTRTYTDVLPSVSLKYEIDCEHQPAGRLWLGHRAARTTRTSSRRFQITETRQQVAAGNPNLKPTHGQSYDVLFEHYLGAVGVISAGGFYKDLKDPIYEGSVTTLTSGPFAGFEQTQPVNGPKAKIYGAEATWQQRLGFLPGLPERPRHHGELHVHGLRRPRSIRRPGEPERPGCSARRPTSST